MRTINPKSITSAEEHLLDGLTVQDQAELITAVRSRGYSNPVALGLVGWLAAKAGGLRDESSQQTRATYRSILRELADDPTSPARVRRAIPGLLKLAGQAA